MWKHIKESLMTEDLRYKENYDINYYRSFYSDLTKFFTAINEEDTETILGCVLLGKIDPNIRLRFKNERRLFIDTYPLSVAVTQYLFDSTKVLLELGADPKSAHIVFNHEDIDSANAENLKRMMKFCEDNGIYYEIADGEKQETES